MAFVNYNNKEITVKIVYYGPGLSGKSTILKHIYENSEYRKKGKLITLDTAGDQTLFFDFVPIEIGKLGDYSIKVQLYTVPGAVSYKTTRKLVLQGADGVVFVADSQIVMRHQNQDSFINLKENLKANNISYEETPLIFIYNKRDLKEILPISVLNSDLNTENKPYFPSIGSLGENVLEAFHAIMKLTIIHLKYKLSIFQKDKTVMFARDNKSSSASIKQPEKHQEITPVKPLNSGNDVFLSYRRDDSADITGRIYDRLSHHFGKKTIFKDVDSMPLGVDFKDYLDEMVGHCAVFLAVIGKDWLKTNDAAGKRAIDDPRDFVRIEIESALKRKIPVIPLFVGRAAMPPDNSLPSSLKKIAFRNGMDVRSDPDFHNDLDRLIRGLEKMGIEAQKG